MPKPCPICPSCSHGDTYQLGDAYAVTLWYTWRCRGCATQFTTRPLAGAEANSRFFHVVKVWR